MKNFALLVLLFGVALSTSAVGAAGDMEWVNSKYHNYGSNWKVFTGIIVFIGVLQSLGLFCEWSYNRSLNRFLKEQDAIDVGDQE